MEAHPPHGEVNVMYEPGTGGAGPELSEISGQIDLSSKEPTKTTTDEAAEIAPEGRAATGSRWNQRIALIGALIALVAAGIVLPPLINIGRYQHQITALIARSLGRPVRLSSVELRLLPRPGFVLHDLSVSEDAGFGAEPVLSARTVVASIRVMSLWRGKVEIDRISVDEASLNLVRSSEGRWNLDSLLLGAQPALTGGAPSGAVAERRFPYLEATDSRINLKRGVEKSPYSLLNTDFSLWQETPGEWRVRLRGQPARTDLEMNMAETGEVRMEATVRRAAQLREMPLQVQMEWREAQLGQLSRLISGSDAGWRGDVTADIEMHGTSDNAQTKTRLRAVGVRREEFAPDTPLDFDANCSFRYQHSLNAFHDVGCDTAIGNGRLHLTAELPGTAGSPEATLAVQQVPVQAALDLLRTVRSGFAPGISAKGTANGSLTYKVVSLADQGTKKLARRGSGKKDAVKAEVVPADLHGSLTVDGGELRGGELKEPIALPKMTLAPVLISDVADAAEGPAAGTGLGTQFVAELAPPARSAGAADAASAQSVPAQSTPAQSVTVRFRAGARGYEAVVSGASTPAGVRDLAYAFGLPHLDAADSFTGGSADFSFMARGPWIPSSEAVAVAEPAGSNLAAQARRPGAAIASAPKELPGHEAFSGSVELHHTQWKTDYLAHPVELAQATVTVVGQAISFTSDFSFGGSKTTGKDGSMSPLRGSVVVNATTNCAAKDCVPQVELKFGALDAAAVQEALLGTPEKKSLFSPLIARMRSSDRPKWPEMVVKVDADSVVLGPATVQKSSVSARLKGNEATVENWQAELFGGSAQGKGHVKWNADQPEYALEGSFARINAGLLGAMLGVKWAGGPLSGKGSIQLDGLTSEQLSASAAGDIRFDWAHGTIPAAGDPTEAALKQTRFDDWSGTVAIQDGKAQVGENAMISGSHSSNVAGSISFGGPIVLSVTPSESKLEAHAGASAALPTVK